jgi:hypothetical protein
MDLRLPPLTQVPALSPISWLPTQPTVLGPIWGNRSRDTSVWGSLFAAPPCSALNRAPSSPRRRTRPAGKLLPSCGGASSLPSNAPSNRVTSAPSGPMRAEKSRAPVSRSETGVRGASETGGTDLQEPGCPPSYSCRRCRRHCCRCQLPSEE